MAKDAPVVGDLYESIPRGLTWEVVGKGPDGRWRLRQVMASRPRRIKRTADELADPFKWRQIRVDELPPESRLDTRQGRSEDN